MRTGRIDVKRPDGEMATGLNLRPFSRIQPHPRQQRPAARQLKVIVQRVQPVVLVCEVQDTKSDIRATLSSDTT